MDRERRKIENERIKFLDLRSNIRSKRREEWRVNSEEVDFDKERKKKGDEPVEKDDEEEKDKDEDDDEENKEKDDREDKESNKKDDNTFKESANENSLASNAFPATSTQDNMSYANPQSQNFQGDRQMQAQTQSSTGNLPGMMNNPQNMMNNQQNMMNNQQNNMNQAMNQGMNQNNMQNNNQMGNRLPSLNSLSIPTMNNQNMMNPPNRMPSLFGQNGMGGGPYGMHPMGMQFAGQNPNVFQGGRMIQPGYTQGVNMYQNNMGMMPYGMGNPYYANMNQMQRQGMMGYNPNMGMMNTGMMGYGNSQFQNPMMRGPFGGQFGMIPPNQQMAMTRNMAINQNMNRNPNSLDSLIQGDQYVPGTLEDHAISALTNTDFNK